MMSPRENIPSGGLMLKMVVVAQQTVITQTVLMLPGLMILSSRLPILKAVKVWWVI